MRGLQGALDLGLQKIILFFDNDTLAFVIVALLIK